MPAPFTAAGICSRAFHLAEHAIEIDSLDQDTAEADLAKLHFDACRRQVLQAAIWHFAVEFIEIESTLSDRIAPDDMPFAYQLPPEVLRVNKVLNERTQKWRIAGRTNVLFCPYEAPIRIDANLDIDEPARFEPDFVAALELLLASRFAARFGKSANRRQVLRADYRELIEEAGQREGYEGGDAYWDSAAAHDWRDDFGAGTLDPYPHTGPSST